MFSGSCSFRRHGLLTACQAGESPKETSPCFCKTVQQFYTIVSGFPIAFSGPASVGGSVSCSHCIPPLVNRVPRCCFSHLAGGTGLYQPFTSPSQALPLTLLPLWPVPHVPLGLCFSVSVCSNVLRNGFLFRRKTRVLEPQGGHTGKQHHGLWVSGLGVA